MLVPTNAIAINESQREHLARLMAEFEQRNGPVQTAPIRIGDAPEYKFCVTPPGKPKPEVPQRDKVPTVRKAVIRKREKTEAIRKLAAQGMDSGQIAAQTGMRQKYVADLAYQAGIRLAMNPKRKVAK
jgi:hypothetical protein